jgi:HPt (histidine-containing phosphotransfer) domain-containing protein
MNDFLTKPVDPALLYDVLGRWLAMPTSAAAIQSTPGSSLEAIDGMDARRGLSFFAGDDEAYRVALQTFLTMYGKGVSPNSPEDSEPSRAQIDRTLHSFGGACSTLGILHLSSEAARISSTMGSRSVEDTAAELQGLDLKIVSFSATLERALHLEPTHRYLSGS